MKNTIGNVLHRVKKKLDEMLFHTAKKPKVHTIDETLDYISCYHPSVSRFGDGEFLMILGHGNKFQSYSKPLADRLKQVINSNIEGHIVCISDIWGDISFMKERSVEFNKDYLKHYGYSVLKIMDCNKEYFNTFFTRPYDMFADKSRSALWFEKNKQIWQGKHILIVEGEKSRLGIGNDLFDNALSVERLLCPAQNAFEKYNEILEQTILHGRNKLILIALGMTATVLSYDLAKMGFWAIDVGHLDIEYEWFLKTAYDKIKIDGKYVNEATGGSEVDDNGIDLDVYNKQIVSKVI